MAAIEQVRVGELVAALEAGTLTPTQLRRALEEAGGQRQQDILYLQAGSTAPDGPVQGMRLIEAGHPVASPDNPDDWPYQTVLEAVRDGWRVISFPNMALLTVPDEEFYGLGFEFILERWR